MKDNPEETKQNILLSAKKEFLEKGFSTASLRKIAENANVTTGALYRHFRDKDTLFGALVEDSVQRTKETVNSVDVSAHAIWNDPLGDEHRQEELQILHVFLKYIYSNFDSFTLLVSKSVGSSYENFVQEITDLYASRCLELCHWMQQHGYTDRLVDDMTIHVLSTNMVLSIIEIIRHETPMEKALPFLDNMQNFYCAGWDRLLGVTSRK